jgi:hypothetical protein
MKAVEASVVGELLHVDLAHVFVSFELGSGSWGRRSSPHRYISSSARKES